MKRFLIFIGLFFLFLWHTFALETNLSVDNSVSNINEYLNIRLQISSDDLASIKQIKILWLDDFEKVWQSQSQSSSSKVVMINWKTESKTITIINFDLQLKPLKNWEFEIWPAIIDTWSWEIKTNVVKVKIDWTNIWIWNNNFLNWNNLINNKNIWNKNLGQMQKFVSTEKQSKSEINLGEYKNNNELYLLILVLILAWVWWYFLIKNDSWTYKNNKEKKMDNLEDEKSGEEEQDFEIIEKIIYPEINDNDFVKKTEKALRLKLKEKFNLKNIDSLTFDEIEKQIWNKLDLSELFAMINKAKYSNIITDYSKILDKIKEI